MNAIPFHGVPPEHRRPYIEATLPIWLHWAAIDKSKGDHAAYALSLATIAELQTELIEQLQAELDAREARDVAR